MVIEDVLQLGQCEEIGRQSSARTRSLVRSEGESQAKKPSLAAAGARCLITDQTALRRRKPYLVSRGAKNTRNFGLRKQKTKKSAQAMPTGGEWQMQGVIARRRTSVDGNRGEEGAVARGERHHRGRPRRARAADFTQARQAALTRTVETRVGGASASSRSPLHPQAATQRHRPEPLTERRPCPITQKQRHRLQSIPSHVGRQSCRDPSYSHPLRLYATAARLPADPHQFYDDKEAEKYGSKYALSLLAPLTCASQFAHDRNPDSHVGARRGAAQSAR